MGRYDKKYNMTVPFMSTVPARSKERDFIISAQQKHGSSAVGAFFDEVMDSGMFSKQIDKGETIVSMVRGTMIDTPLFADVITHKMSSGMTAEEMVNLTALRLLVTSDSSMIEHAASNPKVSANISADVLHANKNISHHDLVSMIQGLDAPLATSSILYNPSFVLEWMINEDGVVEDKLNLDSMLSYLTSPCLDMNLMRSILTRFDNKNYVFDVTIANLHITFELLVEAVKICIDKHGAEELHNSALAVVNADLFEDIEDRMVFLSHILNGVPDRTARMMLLDDVKLQEYVPFLLPDAEPGTINDEFVVTLIAEQIKEESMREQFEDLIRSKAKL